MPRSPLAPVQTDGHVDDPTPVVHLTRRARIEAERAAAATAAGRTPSVTVAGRTSTATVAGPTPSATIAGPAPTATVAGRTPSATATAVSEATRASRPSTDQLVTPATPPAPASPIDLAPASPAMPASTAAPVTPPAPASPAMPASTAAPVTPPAPASPVVAPEAAVPVAPKTRRVAGQVPPSRRPVRAGNTATMHVDRATRHLGAARPAAPAATVDPRRQGAAFRRTASRVTAVGALLFAAGLVVSTSLPAQALWTPGADTTTVGATQSTGATQSMSVGSSAADAETNRDQYSVSSPTQYKHVDASSFTNDPAGTIQWPFLTGVPITSGFGGRQVEGCSFCSTNHMGVDFAPGEGTPIRVIAGGTVIKVQANDGGFGNDVWVQHDVDGKQFVSVYGHMEDNSFKVVKGQQVTVGDELGLVGSTGNSTGPHLHLEVHVDGVPVDPLAWLKANAN